jgi:hypothetical protein
MGIRVKEIQATGHAALVVQSNKVRVDRHGSLRIDECKCCVCAAAQVTDREGRRVFCGIRAAPVGLNFPDDCFKSTVVDNNIFDNSCTTSKAAFIANSVLSGIADPCGASVWSLRFQTSIDTGFCLQAEDSINNPTSGQVPTTPPANTSACWWSAQGMMSVPSLTAVDPENCTTPIEPNYNYAWLQVHYRCGLWIADGYISLPGRTVTGPCHDGTRINTATEMWFRWFHGYLARNSHMAIGETITIPNLQTMTPHSSGTFNVTTPCISEGGELQIDMTTLFMPCNPDDNTTNPAPRTPGDGPLTPPPPPADGNVTSVNVSGVLTGKILFHIHLDYTPHATANLQAGWIRFKGTDNVWYYANVSNRPWFNGNVITVAVNVPAGSTKFLFIGQPFEILFSPSGMTETIFTPAIGTIGTEI